MKNLEEKASLCALGKIFGFEPKTALALISHMGSGSRIFTMNDDELDEVLGPFSKHRRMISPMAQEEAAKELLELEQQGISYSGWTENEYPSLLKECEDPPVGLYIRSETPAEKLWDDRRAIAVVGTRDISHYGKEWCEKIVASFGDCPDKPLIVSGLALGIDICAHTMALEAGLPTVGVMATGPEDIYPQRNRNIANLMAKSPGCALITDYPPGTAPLALHFLRRNRIIAGLAHATILIESRIKGGGMMTSRLAFSYNREVYALPGRADDVRSQGCNLLIRSKIAEPVTSIEDLISSMGMKMRRTGRTLSDSERITTTYGTELSKEKIGMLTSALTAIRINRGISVEELASVLGLPYHKAANMCNMLETDGLISIDLLQRCSINTKFR